MTELVFVVGLLLLSIVASVVHQALIHLSIARGLARISRPGTLAGEAVELVPGRATAIVAGLRQPRIYCTEDLASLLAPDELRAVVLHERHHQLDRAPARLVLLAGIAALFGRVSGARAMILRVRANLEISADCYAIGAGASRATLARAILKIDGSLTTPSTAAGFDSAGELRIRALLGEPWPPVSRIRMALEAVILLAAVLAVPCLVLSLI